jgi:hypothetical protein
MFFTIYTSFIIIFNASRLSIQVASFHLFVRLWPLQPWCYFEQLDNPQTIMYQACIFYKYIGVDGHQVQ